MRDDEIRTRLREQNPWWRAAVSGGDPLTWTRMDPTLRSRSIFDLGYRSDVLDDVATDQIDDKLVILRGPRRIGKSVLLKDTVTDPILAWLGPQIRSGLPEPNFTAMTEACLGVALARAIDAAESGRWIANDSIGCLRTGRGNEIDFAPIPARGPSGPIMTTPIEAKWVATGWRSEARTIEGKFGRGLVATRTITDLQHPSWAVPAPLVALLLN